MEIVNNAYVTRTGAYYSSGGLGCNTTHYWKLFMGTMRDLVRSLIREAISGFDMVLFHGTKNRFDKFDLSFFNSGSGDGGWLGKGFYFTDEYDYADSYAHAISGVDGTVLECRVRLKRPLILSDPAYSTAPLKLANEFGASDSEKLTRILQQEGYDGVVLTEHADKGSFVEVCVFDAGSVEVLRRS